MSRLRYLYQKNRLGRCGRDVFFESDVHLMRYPKNILLGDHLVIKSGARICACNESAKVSIGSRTTFGYYSFLFASHSVEIGEDCLIAPFVYIVDSDHGIEKSEKINRQPNRSEPIVIGNDVWVGTNAKILKGVTIGEGAVVAAGSLVKDDVEPYTIVGGIPSKYISERK